MWRRGGRAGRYRCGMQRADRICAGFGNGRAEGNQICAHINNQEEEGAELGEEGADKVPGRSRHVRVDWAAFAAAVPGHRSARIREIAGAGGTCSGAFAHPWGVAGRGELIVLGWLLGLLCWWKCAVFVLRFLVWRRMDWCFGLGHPRVLHVTVGAERPVRAVGVPVEAGECAWRTSCVVCVLTE